MNTTSKYRLSVNRSYIMLSVLFSLCVVTKAFAGLHGLTAHSRANCGNNESITWHAGYNY